MTGTITLGPAGGADPPDGRTSPWRAVRLPPLRDDLALLPAPAAPDGAPCWTIHDPVRNRYFRIGHGAFEVIARWHLGSPDAIADRVAAETLLSPTPEDVVGLYQFLAASNLVQTLDTVYLARQAAARRTSWFWWLIHNYLFFRIPVVRPDRFLAATLPLVGFCYSAAWRWTVIVAGGVGGILVLRQWDRFIHTFLHFFSLEGAALYGLTLLGVKVLHELGHGYTARRHGCRVPTMGVAFLVLWPVLYTDTTDAWRLVSRRQRLAIGAAGMLTELSIAAFATLAWSFLPDGSWRSAAFLLATVTWISTLAVNLSPFMRFDGYYLLADALDVPNLQERAFALTRWRLREWLFGLGDPPPEVFAPRLRRTLLAYALFTWGYRLILFIGIALVVYHMFFKALGIVLFAVEIGWFVLKPIANEAGNWWRRRDRFRVNGPLLATLAGMVGLVWLATMPLTTTVPVPAVWRAGNFATLFAPVPARLDEVLVVPGQAVAEGQMLFRLAAPELASRLRQTELRIDLLQAQIARQTASQEGLDRVRVMEGELAAALAERRGLVDSLARLDIRAPLAGRVVDMAESLTPGRWVNPKLALAMVVTEAGSHHGRGELIGYVHEEDLGRLAPGADATFYPDDPGQPPVAARVLAVDQISAAALDVAALASVHGGPIAAEATDRQADRTLLVPADAVYRVVLAPADSALPVPRHIIRGVARVTAEARSLVGRFWRSAVAVLIRETGF